MTATHRFPKLVHVTSVEVVHDHVVRLGFSDGCVGELDLAPRLWGPVFKPLMADYELFCQVSVDPEARTLVWPGDLDLAPEVLHLEAATKCPDAYGSSDPSKLTRLRSYMLRRFPKVDGRAR